MCYIDKTNYAECANPDRHNSTRQVDPREFEASYPQYQYPPICPGYVPCQPVLQGQLSAQQCHDTHHGPAELRLAQPTLCPHCNCIRLEQGHQVTYRAGRIVQVTYFQDPQTQQTHQVHPPFVPFCLLCRNTAGENLGKIGGGPPAQEARFGYAPSGPPGREAYGSYDWGPSFR